MRNVGLSRVTREEIDALLAKHGVYDEERGIPYAQWHMLDISRQAEQYREAMRKRKPVDPVAAPPAVEAEENPQASFGGDFDLPPAA